MDSGRHEKGLEENFLLGVNQNYAFVFLNMRDRLGRDFRSAASARSDFDGPYGSDRNLDVCHRATAFSRDFGNAKPWLRFCYGRSRRGSRIVEKFYRGLGLDDRNSSLSWRSVTSS
jgi:hypothetical protein